MTALRSCPRASASVAPPLRAGPSLGGDAFANIRRDLVLNCCKWDPQVGDVSTLADFPLMISSRAWHELSQLAEDLAAEASQAQAELMVRPSLHAKLGLPRALRRVLARCARGRPTPGAAQVIRFDFHWTVHGWRISEANSDVPGGYSEAASFASAMADHYPGTRPAGDPAAALVDAIGGHVAQGGCVALLSAAGYMEDQQVVAYLSRRLAQSGLAARCCRPDQLTWIQGRANLSGAAAGRVDAIIRFYQGEWLANLPAASGWSRLLIDGKTPVTNPAAALFSESKRFPLAWDSLATKLPTWRRLLPETRDPRDAPWRRDDGWLLKAAFCNTGDSVLARGITPERTWRAAAREARWFPGQWAAQRRFEPVRIDTPLGGAVVCLGVYVVDGRAAGIYGRVTARPLVDYAAVDVAVLVEPEPGVRP